MTTTVFNTKISEVEYKMSDMSCVVTKAVFNTKISQVENKISDNSTYITAQ